MSSSDLLPETTARWSAEPAPPRQLLYITHARQDEAWVQGVLVPALGLAQDQFWTHAQDDLGAPTLLVEIERAVEACRYTLLVASSAARADEWTQLAGLLAQHLGTEEGKPRLLVLTRDFDPESERARELLPLRQRCLACLDCSDPEHSTAALATLASQLALTTTEETPAECPYPGLRMFGAGDPASCFDRPDLFFGRDAESCAVIERLHASGRVLLVGPSGCGKSSLVRARVLPMLGGGPGAMSIAVVRPGRDPDGALRAALEVLDPPLAAAIDAGLAVGTDRPETSAAEVATGGRGRLIYVDQLEEVFLDEEGSPASRAAFFARLAALAHAPGVAVLLGMRADFYGDLMRSPAWDDFKDHRVELAPLRGAALREAIVHPAERVGVHVEVDLVERLVREADQDRAAEALPLLQVALEQLWAQREWRYLSLASYARIADGDRRGLDAVLARHADASIAMLSAPAQELARRVLIDLVHLGEGRPDTRRRRTSSELRRAGDAAAQLDVVLAHLSARRLITVGAELDISAAVRGVEISTADGAPAVVERHVDLAHDTLITGWPALAGWIAARRDDLRTQRRLEARAASGGLLAVSELPEFTRWVAWIDTPAGQAIGTSEALRALVRRSVRVRRAQRVRLIASLLTVIVVLAVAAGVALWQQQRATRSAEDAIAQTRLAESEKAIANSNALTAESEAWIDLDPGRAAQMLQDALNQHVSPRAERLARRWQERRVRAAIPTRAAMDADAAWLAPGRLATQGKSNQVVIWIERERMWDIAQTIEVGHDVVGLASQAKGPGLAIVTRSSVELWIPGAVSPKWRSSVEAGDGLKFVPDGTKLLCLQGKRLTVLDAATGRTLHAFDIERTEPGRVIQMTTNGTVVWLASENLRVWTLTGQRVPFEIEGVSAAANIGGEVVIGQQDSMLRIGFAPEDHRGGGRTGLSGKIRPSWLRNTTASVLSLHVESEMVAALQLYSVSFHSARSGKEIAPPVSTHPVGCNRVAWEPGGKRLALACLDGLVRVMDLMPPSAWAEDPTPGGWGCVLRSRPHTLELSTHCVNKGVVFTTSSRHIVHCHDVEDPWQWSPDGRRIASGSNGAVRVFKAEPECTLEWSSAPAGDEIDSIDWVSGEELVIGLRRGGVRLVKQGSDALEAPGGAALDKVTEVAALGVTVVGHSPKEGTIVAWNMADGSLLKVSDGSGARIQLTHPMIAPRPDRKAFALIARSGDVILLSRDLRELGRYPGVGDVPFHLEWNWDGNVLAVASGLGINLLDGEDLQPVRDRIGTGGGIPSLHWKPHMLFMYVMRKNKPISLSIEHLPLSTVRADLRSYLSWLKEVSRRF